MSFDLIAGIKPNTAPVVSNQVRDEMAESILDSRLDCLLRVTLLLYDP